MTLGLEYEVIAFLRTLQGSVKDNRVLTQTDHYEIEARVNYLLRKIEEERGNQRPA